MKKITLMITTLMFCLGFASVANANFSLSQAEDVIVQCANTVMSEKYGKEIQIGQYTLRDVVKSVHTPNKKYGTISFLVVTISASQSIRDGKLADRIVIYLAAIEYKDTIDFVGYGVVLNSEDKEDSEETIATVVSWIDDELFKKEIIEVNKKNRRS